MKSDSIGNIAKALSQAQDEIKGAPLDSVNPFVSSKYASLGAVIEVIRPVLKKNGLSYTQLIAGDETHIILKTLLMHESGEWLLSEVGMPVVDEKDTRKTSVQVAGSIITYLRRYSLAAMFGVYAEEDTDGNGSQQGGNRAGRQQQGQAKSKSNGNGNKQASQPAKPLTIEEALAVTSPGGHRMGELTPEQLEQLSTATHSKITDQMRQAAKIVLAEIAAVQAGPAEPQEQA